MKVLVVGSGCCGASAARRLAELGWEVTVAERRPHIGGNAYDRREDCGLLYHVYGPHIFFTDDAEVWKFLYPFAQWIPFQCTVQVSISGTRYPMPFQPKTLRSLLPGPVGEEAARQLSIQYPKPVTISELMACKVPALREAAHRLYMLDCVPYNQKMWGLSPEALSPEVVGRTPVFPIDREQFRPEQFQFMPEEGFTALFEKLLSHAHIQVRTGVEGEELVGIAEGQRLQWRAEGYDALLYTGALDRLFHYCDGSLPYRTLEFDYRRVPVEDGLPCPAVYYPDLDLPYTRQTDYRHLPGNEDRDNWTLVVSEIPRPVSEASDEPYYVVLTPASRECYQRYRRRAEKIPHLYVAGRLADFRYYNMDEAVRRGLDIAAEIDQRERSVHLC